MWLFCIDQQGTDVGLFDGCKCANSREFFDTDFSLARLPKSSGVKNFNSLAFELDANTIDVTSGSLFGADDGLLFLTKSIKETGFSNIWAANEG